MRTVVVLGAATAMGRGYRLSTPPPPAKATRPSFACVCPMRPAALRAIIGAMATIRREIVIDASPEAVWDAVRDWGALDRRLAPGFVTECHEEGADRIVTFFNGAVVRERFISSDDAARRLVWSIVDGPYAHHNGAAQVLEDQDGRARFVWTSDLLPDERAPGTAEMMERGLAAVKATLGR
jgi:hypothetical protein